MLSVMATTWTRRVLGVPVVLMLMTGIAGAGSGPVDEATGGESTETLEGQVDVLNRRVQGMAGKLKESATARKGADQARMEAERRLAEIVQENHRISAELGLLRDARLALEVAMARAEEREAKTNAALETARESIGSLSADREVRDQRIADLEVELEEVRQTLRETESAHAARIAALETTQGRLQAELDARNSQIRRLGADLKAIDNERDNLSHRLDAMRSVVPTAEGGSLTLEEAQARASKAAQALRSVVQPKVSLGLAADRRAQRDAEQELHRFQFAAARVSGARSVYRVRPNDTLALIARRLYGDSARWREIGEANRHVLADPNHLTPGMTLVVP